MSEWVSDVAPALVTTIGTLIGSFGGFTLAAWSQRRQAEEANARATLEAERSRRIELENERHDFQLKTLLALQELTRMQTRSAILVIEEDRQTLLSGRSYSRLTSETPEHIANSVEFSHHVARVTNDELRQALEQFSALCSEYSMPPSNWQEMDNALLIAIQEQRFSSLADKAGEASALLGEHLRAEISRHDAA